MINLKILITLLFICLCSCKSRTKTKPVVVDTIKSVCTPYFDFDEVEYYSIKVDEPDIWKVYEKKDKTGDEERFINLILKDTVILTGMEKFGYMKKPVSTDKVGILSSIFCERKHEASDAMACIALYRDILIFKKQGSITGTAKICFGCRQSRITGTKLNTDEFGQSGDYEKLEKLLYN